MARPTTKAALIAASTDKYTELIDLLGSMTPAEIEQPFSFDLSKEKGAHWQRDQNIHDVLIHLHEWHKLLIDWVVSNQKGEAKPFLKEGYNWRNYGLMNQAFRDENQDSSYQEALALFQASHERVMTLLADFTTDALFTKQVYLWVGGSTLGSYFISSTASHYDWAIKKIKKFKQGLLVDVGIQ